MVAAKSTCGKRCFMLPNMDLRTGVADRKRLEAEELWAKLIKVRKETER